MEGSATLKPIVSTEEAEEHIDDSVKGKTYDLARVLRRLRLRRRTRFFRHFARIANCLLLKERYCQ
jgi:hypothetical protein